MNYKRNMVPQMAAPGWYFAQITEIKEGNPVQTKLGQSVTALTTFHTDNHCIVTQSFLMAPGVNFLLEKLIDAAIGVGEEQVDLEELVGKRVGIKVEHKFWKDRVFANVVDVCSVDELQEDSEEYTPPTHKFTDIEELDLN